MLEYATKLVQWPHVLLELIPFLFVCPACRQPSFASSGTGSDAKDTAIQPVSLSVGCVRTEIFFFWQLDDIFQFSLCIWRAGGWGVRTGHSGRKPPRGRDSRPQDTVACSGAPRNGRVTPLLLPSVSRCPEGCFFPMRRGRGGFALVFPQAAHGLLCAQLGARTEGDSLNTYPLLLIGQVLPPLCTYTKVFRIHVWMQKPTRNLPYLASDSFGGRSARAGIVGSGGAELEAGGA